VNKKTGMVQVRAQFANEEMLLWPGQFTKAHIILNHIQDAVLVPETAVNLGQGFKYVFVLEGAKAVLHKVKTGLQLGSVVQILEGINAGDEVVIDGQINVVPDSEVNVQSVNKKWAEGIDCEHF